MIEHLVRIATPELPSIGNANHLHESRGMEWLCPVTRSDSIVAEHIDWVALAVWQATANDLPSC